MLILRFRVPSSMQAPGNLFHPNPIPSFNKKIITVHLRTGFMGIIPVSIHNMPSTNPSINGVKKKKRSMRLIALVVALVVINVFAGFFHGQADLTKGGRYSITPATKQMLKKLDKPVFVTVFLTGNDLPAAYKKLSVSTEDLLRTFSDISGHQVDYRMVDPLGNDTIATRALEEFRMRGFPVTIPNGKKGLQQKMIFPWALIVMDGKPWPVMLQESNATVLSRKILGKSEELLEYNIATAIHQLSKASPDTIAYLTGHGEPFGYEVFSAFNNLGRFYVLDTFNLNQHNTIPPFYKSIIINRPLLAFDEIAKFKIDQYLMHGGHIFWGINAVNGSLDSFRNASQFNALPVEVNLSDMLFRYGVRINANLIKDADNCIDLPLPTSENDANPPSYPWQYFPILHPPKDAGSPIVKNLNEILGKFVSSIDTNTNDPNIRKTALLVTSRYTTLEGVPAPVILASAAEPVNRSAYGNPNSMAAVLLEGPFISAFQGYLPAPVRSFVDSLGIQPVMQAPPDAGMIVVSDGDLIMNDVDERQGPMDMGMYAFSPYRFENRNFLLNSVEYLSDQDNLLDARSKSFEPQLLDAVRVSQERSKWQWINLGVPAGLVFLFGSVYLLLRKKRYA